MTPDRSCKKGSLVRFDVQWVSVDFRQSSCLAKNLETQLVHPAVRPDGYWVDGPLQEQQATCPGARRGTSRRHIGETVRHAPCCDFPRGACEETDAQRQRLSGGLAGRGPGTGPPRR